MMLRVKGLLSTIVVLALLAVGLFGGAPGLALVALIIYEAYLIWTLGGDFVEQAIARSPFWLSSPAVLVMMLLSPKPGTQIGLLIAYGIWRASLDPLMALRPWVVAVLTQFLALDALFMAASVWHWPTLAIVVLTWGISWLVATRALSDYSDRAATALAATWALVAAECAWVFSLWLVNYIVLGGILIVPQAAVVLSALGYCMGGIYASHRASQLSRNRLVEYLLIGLFLLAIVIAGTKWNGII